MCNGRFVDSDGHWSYQLNSYNIAYGKQISADVFLRSSPERETVLLANLR